MKCEEHIVRAATDEESKQDCCGDRTVCDVSCVCTCGRKACSHCMKEHIFNLHTVKQLGLYEEQL